jgi:hypothetical protein
MHYILGKGKHPNIQNDSTSTPDENAASSQEQSSIMTESAQSVMKRGWKDFVTQKSAAALDRCQLSIRDCFYSASDNLKAWT